MCLLKELQRAVHSGHTELLSPASPMPGAAVRTGTTTPLPSTSLATQYPATSPGPAESRGNTTLCAPHQNPWRGARNGQDTHTSQRGSGRWDGRTASALTEDGEAAENLGVVFNSQGHERVGRSTDLWEKQPCQGRHGERGRAADPALGTGTSRGGCGNTPRHGSAERSFPHAEHQLGCAQSGPSPPGGVWELDVLCYLKVSCCPAGRASAASPEGADLSGAIKVPQAPGAARPAHVCSLRSAKRTLRAAAEPELLC